MGPFCADEKLSSMYETIIEPNESEFALWYLHCIIKMACNYALLGIILLYFKDDA